MGRQDNTFELNENRLKSAAGYWNKLLKENEIKNRDMILLMSSNDFEVNYYSVTFLKSLKYEKNFERLFILSDLEENLHIAQRYSTMPFTFIKCSTRESIDLQWLYALYRFTDQLLINSFEYAADTDAFRLVNGKDITKKDIVAMACLKLEKVPSEENDQGKKIEVKINYKPLDWNMIEDDIPYANDEFTLLHEYFDAGLYPLIVKKVIHVQDQLVIFGLSKATLYLIKKLHNYNIVAIIDNNSSKEGQYIKGIPVFMPETFLGEYKKDVIILVPSICYKDMCEQLNYMGYEYGKQVFIAYCRNYLLSTSEKSIDFVIKEVEKGKIVYDSLKKKVGDVHFFLCPYPGTGDVYLLGLYLRQMVIQQKINDYVVLTVSQSCAKVAEMFGFNSTKLSPKEAELLLMFFRFMKKDIENVTICNDGFLQRMVPRLRGYKSVDFHTMFRKLVFKVDKKINSPVCKLETADGLFEKYYLMKGKTILLSPYANTVYDISLDFWEKLSKELQVRGYDVCTNCSSGSETAIKGTCGVFIPYNQAIDFLNQAGGFIALRSGLCDIVSSAKAKKVIFYPEGKTLLNSSSYEYFSLVKMGLSEEDTTELEFKKNDEMNLLQKVLNRFSYVGDCL